MADLWEVESLPDDWGLVVVFEREGLSARNVKVA